MQSSRQRREIEGAVPVNLAGRALTLRLSMDGLAVFDETSQNADARSVRGFRALVWAMLLPFDLTLHEVGSLIGGGDMQQASAAVAECLRLCMPPQSEAQIEPGERQPTDWWRIWAFARNDLRLSDEQFWYLTPRQFCVLAERHYTALRALHGVGEEENPANTPEGKLANTKRLLAKRGPLMAAFPGVHHG